MVAALLLAVAGGASAKTVWLCKPGLQHNPCDLSRTATQENEDGSKTVVKFPAPKTKPKVDCFYVYPTVSGQRTAVANLNIDPDETAIAEQQASRFSTKCRVFAPMYRQSTIVGINGGAQATPAEAAEGPADVLAAFKEYLKQDSHGRGFVLIGHSQGAFVLKDLIAKQIDNNPKLRKRLVSAVLLGGNVTVKKGKDVGGQFKKIPACRATKQVGCVIAYSSFDTEPPSNAVFGRVSGFGGAAGSGLEVLCTNPADLSGGKAYLEPYVRTVPFPGTLGLAINLVPKESTPWAGSPKQYTAQCKNKDGSQWLQISHRASDPRPYFKATLGATWGLHLGDVNLAWGNLVKDVGAEAKAYGKKK